MSYYVNTPVQGVYSVLTYMQLNVITNEYVQSIGKIAVRNCNNALKSMVIIRLVRNISNQAYSLNNVVLVCCLCVHDRFIQLAQTMLMQKPESLRLWMER